MKYILSLFILTITFLDAKACKCAWQSIEDEFKNNDFIVNAKVASIKSDPNNSEFNILELKVRRNHKEISPKFIRVEAATYQKEKYLIENTCGMDIKAGERWLFFGTQSSTNSCTRSTKNPKTIADITKQLKALKRDN